MLVDRMLPSFDRRGNLPRGVHFAEWQEIVQRYSGSPRRRDLISGLQEALIGLASAGCRLAYIDGSFVTSKAEPGDFDACWSIATVDVDKLDPVFLDFSNGRSGQKERFGGELFPAELPEGVSGNAFLDFFQTDRNTGASKGIVGIVLSLENLTSPNLDDALES